MFPTFSRRPVFTTAKHCSANWRLSTAWPLSSICCHERQDGARTPWRLAEERLRHKQSVHDLLSFRLYSAAQKSVKRKLHEDSCFEVADLFYYPCRKHLEVIAATRRQRKMGL